jgi:hypothetical protein
LIRLLFSVFTEAIGRIWQPYHPWSWSCWSYRDQNNFCVKHNFLIISQILHSLTKPQY